ncbi:MAG: AAA family ATPase [bacterium]|nr:AAA family ATPase [bacterium]
MYLEFWGFSELPFENVPDPRFFYPSAEHQEALLRLFYAVNSRKGAAMLTGEIGCGKTILSRTLIQDLPPDRYEVGVIANPSLTPIEFLREILYQLGVESKANSKLDLLHALNDQVTRNLNAGRDTVVIIDEAQAIEDPETLEELRLLLNFQLNDRFLLTLLLMGQPELKDKIAKIKQLEQRIAIKFHLGPLKLEETRAYIQTRVDKAGLKRKIFNDDAVEAIHRASRGIPREINNICDVSLLLGFGTRMNIIDTDLILKATQAVKQL